MIDNISKGFDNLTDDQLKEISKANFYLVDKSPGGDFMLFRRKAKLKIVTNGTLVDSAETSISKSDIFNFSDKTVSFLNEFVELSIVVASTNILNNEKVRKAVSGNLPSSRLINDNKVNIEYNSLASGIRRSVNLLLSNLNEYKYDSVSAIMICSIRLNKIDKTMVPAFNCIFHTVKDGNNEYFSI